MTADSIGWKGWNWKAVKKLVEMSEYSQFF